MKKSKKLILLLVITLLFFSGCTTQLKNKDNKIVTNPETGQSLTENILCRPTDKTLLKLYEENDFKMDKLPDCNKFSISSEYESIWNTIFVRPLAWLILKIGEFVKSYALSIVIITIIIRLAMYPLTRKTAMQSENMKKAQPELTKLEEKYKTRTTKEDQAAKANEMMLIYKKHDIHLVGGCLTTFLQLPIFFAFLEAINRVPAIFEEQIFGLQLGITPITAIKTGHWWIIVLNILIVLVTFYSFKLTGTTGDESSQKQTKIMSKVMVVFIGFISFSLPAAIAIYWIVSSGLTVLQNILVKYKRRG